MAVSDLRLYRTCSPKNVNGKFYRDYFLNVKVRGLEKKIHFVPKDPASTAWDNVDVSFDETGKVATYLIIEDKVMTDTRGHAQPYRSYFASLIIDDIDYRSQIIPKGTSDKDLLNSFLAELEAKSITERNK